MKKEYILPAMEVIELKVSSMLMQASMNIGEGTVTSDEQLGREDNNVGRPSNPNIWESMW